MHIDMNKIEQMVQLFIKLNTDSQEKLMKKGYELLFTQKSKEELIESKEIKILGNGMLAKSDEQKIYQKTNKKIEHMENILELIDTDDMHKEKLTGMNVSVISHMCAGTQKRFNEKTIQKLESVLEISIPDISNDAEAIMDSCIDYCTLWMQIRIRDIRWWRHNIGCLPGSGDSLLRD